MRILVTGGAGFIGSSVARMLRRRGDTAVIYDNFSTGSRHFLSGFEVIEGDIGNSGQLKQALSGVDAVMHFAARAYVGESFVAPRDYFENNVSKALILLNAVIDAGVDKFIFSSSCAVYGTPATLPISEETPRLPINPYGQTKATFEDALAAYARVFNLRYMALRYFNASGAEENGTIGELHDPETHLIPLILQAVHTPDSQFQINGADYDTPDGTCVRDFIHVSDLARAHIAALDYLTNDGASNIVNLGTGHGASILELLALVEEITSIKVAPNFSPRRPGDPPVLVSDARRAHELLGWQPQIGLRDILLSAWQWEQNRQRYQKL
jgi:UDP-glucose-4-epimerase GalE